MIRNFGEFIIALLLGMMIGLGIARHAAHALNYMDDPETPKEVHEWYAGVTMPTGRQSCCGEADAYWADKWVMHGEDFYAVLTDPRQIDGRREWPIGTEILVTPDKIDPKHQGNPTGHTIIFLAVGDGHVYCYFPNAGV